MAQNDTTKSFYLLIFIQYFKKAEVTFVTQELDIGTYVGLNDENQVEQAANQQV